MRTTADFGNKEAVDRALPAGTLVDVDPNLMPNMTSEPKKLTGGSADYYRAPVPRPTHGGDPYIAECNDVIEALNMTFAEGEAFKAIWRHAIVRQGRGKPGSTKKYEAEKVEFFGKRLVALADDHA